MYTLADLDKAKEERRAVEARWESYSGNNPNKFRAQCNDAKAKFELIEAHLKASGQIPLSDHEILVMELDRLFPDARSKEIVEHRVNRYQRRFTPAEYSGSGNVTRWHRSWVAAA